jgi:hypothetical protein
LVDIQRKNFTRDACLSPHFLLAVTIPISIEPKKPLSQTLDEHFKEDFKRARSQEKNKSILRTAENPNAESADVGVKAANS